MPGRAKAAPSRAEQPDQQTCPHECTALPRVSFVPGARSAFGCRLADLRGRQMEDLTFMSLIPGAGSAVIVSRGAVVSRPSETS